MFITFVLGLIVGAFITAMEEVTFYDKVNDKVNDKLVEDLDKVVFEFQNQMDEISIMFRRDLETEEKRLIKMIDEYYENNHRSESQSH